MSNKTSFGILLIVIGLFMSVWLIFSGIQATYTYQNKISYAWTLADKSSTLEAKANYMDEFIKNLEGNNFAEYNAIFLKTPDNNVQNNINAVKTLRGRLEQVKSLDPESFAYQTAIQQITEQEQGQASEMLSVIEGGWELANGYWMVWGWIFGIILFIIMGSIGLGIGLISMGVYDEF